jgi:uncharacterized protein
VSSYPAKHLLIGSLAAHSGKSAAILGLIPQLLSRGLMVAVGKLLSLNLSSGAQGNLDSDVSFMTAALGLTESQTVNPLLTLSEADLLRSLTTGEVTAGVTAIEPGMPALATNSDVLLLEGPSTLAEGKFCGFSLQQQADALKAAVLLVIRCQSLAVIDELLAAKAQLGDCLCGIVLNDVPDAFRQNEIKSIVPFLEQHGISVFGVLPGHPLLRSISVKEVVHQLKAEVLCCGDRLNLMVEQLSIGAMNVNSALRYFNRAHNMAVVTGGDRTDIQLAALESSTNCLILTGHFSPNTIVLNRAEDLEVPVLSVDLDTLTTVELVDKAFSEARFSETIKVDCIQQLFQQHVDVDRLFAALELKPPVHS